MADNETCNRPPYAASYFTHLKLPSVRTEVWKQLNYALRPGLATLCALLAMGDIRWQTFLQLPSLGVVFAMIISSSVKSTGSAILLYIIMVFNLFWICVFTVPIGYGISQASDEVQRILMPVLTAVSVILEGQVSAREAVEEVMNLPQQEEV